MFKLIKSVTDEKMCSMKPMSDPLTGLHTREYLITLRNEFRKRVNDSVWTAVMIDIDHFKLINDIYGHLSGDEVIREVASLLETNLRENDVILRFGGDEFLGIFKDTPLENALNFCERISESIPRIVVAHDVKLTLSMGVADSKANDTILDDVIERADRAVYRGKESGRGRISFYADEGAIPASGKIRLNHFVGRQPELKRLRQLLDETISDSSRFTIIEGEAGIGKSRLANELIHYASFHQCTVLKCECYEFGDTEPYGFILNPLRNYFQESESKKIDWIRESVDSMHPATAELFPDVKFRVSPDIQFFREERLKFRIFEDFRRLLHTLSQRNPLVLIIDDVQWIPPPDLELLKYIVRSSVRDHIFFISTLRCREAQTEFIRRQLLTLKRSIPLLPLRLSKLEKQETSNLIMFALKDPNIPSIVLEKVHSQCGGNPFFLEELLNALMLSGAIKQTVSGDWSYYLSKELQLPESLAQLIESRLYPLNETSRNLLRIAALHTGSFSSELLHAATQIAESKIIEYLEEPVKLGLIEAIDGKLNPTYRFTHDTICNFLHRELSDAVKSIYHLRMAEFFENQHSHTHSDDPIVPMAYHFSQSNDLEKARNSALLASQLFEKRQATRDTIRWLEKFVSLASPDNNDETGLFDIHLKLGSKYSIIGDGAKAEHQYAIAQKLAETNAQKVDLLLKKGANLQAMSRYKEARECFEKVISMSTKALPKIDALNAIAFMDYICGFLPSAKQKLEIIESTLINLEGKTHLLEKYWAVFYTTKGVVACAENPGQIAVQNYEKALELFKKHGDSLGEATIYNNLSDIYPRSGQYEEALEILKKAEKISSQYDDALNLAIVYYNTAIIYLEINQPRLAKDYFQKYEESSREINNELGLGYGNLGMGTLYEEEENYTLAEKSYLKALSIFTKLGSKSLVSAVRLSLIKLMLLRNEPDRAKGFYRDLPGLVESDVNSDLLSELEFTKGLLEFDNYKRNQDLCSLEKAEHQIRKSLAHFHYTDLGTLMRRYCVYATVLLHEKKHDEYVEIIKKAMQIIRERTSKVSKSYIKKSILRKRHIQDVINMYNSEIGSTQ